MKKGFLLLILIICCSSCATILTGRRSTVEIHTNKNVQLVVEGDTINRSTNRPVVVDVRNSKHPLPIVVLDSTRQEFLAVAPRKPFTYWLNAVPTIFFAGFLVDEVSGLKWRYPRKVLIQSDPDDISFTPYLPMDPSLLDRKNKITFAPLSLVNGYHPAWEIGYERLQGDKRSTQFSLGLLRSWTNDFARNSKGLQLAVERKMFFHNQQTTRVYASVNLEYLHKDHDAVLRFVVTDADGNNAIPRQEFSRLTTIQKRFVTVTPRIGVQHYLTPQLVVEGFFGVGMRYRDVKHEGNNPFARHIDDFDGFFFDTKYSSNREARHYRPNFDLNFRLAWAF